LFTDCSSAQADSKTHPRSVRAFGLNPGGPKNSLAVADKTLEEVKAIIEGSKRVEGKLPPATIKKIEKFLLAAV
jgi:hypothetical protein